MIQSLMNGVINFLDVLMKKTGDGFLTSVYRKPTHLDRYLRFLQPPLQPENGRTHNVKKQSRILLQHLSLLQAELDHLCRMFSSKMAYPKDIVSANLFSRNKTHTQNEADQKYKGPLKLPYIKELHNPLQNLCRRTEVKLLSKRSRNLGNILVSHRPKRQGLEKRAIVYKVNCENCNTCYIGQTKRQLGTRMDEQLDDCCNEAKQRGHVGEKSNGTGLP